MGLIEIDYKGTKIDKCSGYEVVWFDAGKLEAAADLEKSTLDKLFGVIRR